MDEMVITIRSAHILISNKEATRHLAVESGQETALEMMRRRKPGKP
jgi:hypothetical protein